ncbi:MAG: DUF255 domain-containing protein [Pseudomonadota bacterium]|nr:DUF255 domain-containing protein [Pseudomonadota bacterium]
MKFRRFFRPTALLGPLVVLVGLVAAVAPVRAELDWRSWSADLFDVARAENRFVILDLEAVWCHWCHVMEEKTYRDPKVVDLLKSRYLPVRVDQDANPDISSRYGDWGWPATIVFAPDGSEIVKLSGYIPPERMAAILQAIIDDPSPGPSVLPQAEITASETSLLTAAQRELLLSNYDAVYDETNGGWGSVHKFLHTESMDYALEAASRGDEKAARRARQTLDAALNLFDREWGGVYQYSDEVDWKSPHYEKIMSYQSSYLRHYSLAWALWGEERYQQAAKDIVRYLTGMMRDESGAFYTSQDADLDRTVSGKTFYALPAAERAKLGMPRIDRNLYARENGWAISGLAAYHAATGDGAALKHAIQAAEWVIANRSLEGGGFAHSANDRGGPFLGDSLAMGQAALDLYAATGERKWFLAAARAGDFIDVNFRHATAGYMTTRTRIAEVGVFSRPVVQIEENIQLARFANMLHRYTGSEGHKAVAEHAMRFLTTNDVTSMRRFLVGVVQADEEVAREPIHITIVGPRDHADSRSLHAAAQRFPALYKRVDWWDKREGPMPNPDVEYPELDRPAAFACAERICSLPVFEPGELPAVVRRVSGVSRGAQRQ